jgi:putative ABC transport system ATP-binding protein
MPVSPLQLEPPKPEQLVLEGVRVDVGRVPVLDMPKLELAPGARVGIAGVSGSGKTTLLHVISGLRRPASGRVLWGNTDVAAMSPQQGDDWRRSTIGLVFQDFQLIPELDALDNVLLPTTFAIDPNRRGMAAEARRLLASMGIARGDLRVARLSRGEQQRVAIARALLARPALILADEPTASLDAANAAAIADLLVTAARATGATLIVVSHDPAVLARLDRTVPLRAAGGRYDAAL